MVDPSRLPAPVVEMAIQFTVGRVKVFVVIAFAYPWEIIIGTSCWKSIISHGKNFVFVTDNTGSNLCVWIFGTHTGEHGNAMKYSSQLM